MVQIFLSMRAHTWAVWIETSVDANVQHLWARASELLVFAGIYPQPNRFGGYLLLRHFSHKICLDPCFQLKFDLNTSFDFTYMIRQMIRQCSGRVRDQLSISPLDSIQFWWSFFTIYIIQYSIIYWGASHPKNIQRSCIDRKARCLLHRTLP
jgi:hypothetical protein